MATPGQLIDAYAAALCLPRSVVEANYRSLREDGLVTKGGRGKSAPTSTPQDAAALLIALMTRETAINASLTYVEFAALPLLIVFESEVGDGADLPAIDMFDVPSTFVDGIVLLLAELPRLVADLDKSAKLAKRRIVIETDVTGTTAGIRVGSSYAQYESLESGLEPEHAMRTKRMVGERSLAMIYDCLTK